MLAALSVSRRWFGLEFVQQRLHVIGASLPLIRQDADLRQEQTQMGADGVDDAGGRRERGRVELREDIVGRYAPNSVFAQEPIDACACHSRWTDHELEQRPEPRFVGAGAERQEPRREAVNLLPHAIGKAAQVDLQVVLGP